MAFGITRQELMNWKRQVKRGEIAFLTHYWQDERFPNATTVTKVGCNQITKLIEWGNQYGLKKEWIHYHHTFPHFDLFGEKQRIILQTEKLNNHMRRFRL